MVETPQTDNFFSNIIRSLTCKRRSSKDRSSSHELNFQNNNNNKTSSTSSNSSKSESTSPQHPPHPDDSEESDKFHTDAGTIPTDQNSMERLTELTSYNQPTKLQTKGQVGYVDGCFDLMHSGHYNAIRQAAMLCDKLVVGIHSDEEISKNKGPPVLKQEERYGLLEHVKWIDRVFPNVPYSPSINTLDACGAHFCVHGDDMPVDSSGRGAYDDMKDAGRLRIVKRTEGVSTTDFIGRLLSLTKEHHNKDREVVEAATGSEGGGGGSPENNNSNSTVTPRLNLNSNTVTKSGVEKNSKATAISSGAQTPLTPTPASAVAHTVEEAAKKAKAMRTLSQQGVKLLASTRRIAEFSKPNRIPTADDVVVYCDGAWDMFHIGHASTLEKAKQLGTFLIVGIHDDEIVNQFKGANYPIATLQERVLCVCACKHVDEVIMGAPLTITKDMISTLNIKYVVTGSHSETNNFREPGYVIDIKTLRNTEDDPHYIPREMGMLRTVKSDYPELTTAVIASRVAENRLAYMKRNLDRSEREANYYKEKEERGAGEKVEEV